MTKISQLADIGANLAANDEFVIRDVSDASTPNKKVTASGFFNVATALGFTGLDLIRAGVANEAVVQAIASGVSGYAQTTISGVASTRQTISGYFENASGITSSVFYPVVTQTDIGTGANQISLNGQLGDMAFADYPFWRGATNTTTTSGTLIIDGSLVERFNYTASMATGVTVQFSNLTSGREVKLYIRNTNATARPVTFQGSTTTSGHVNIELAPGAGAASVSGVTLAANNGTAIVWVSNINNSIVGGLV